MVLPTTTSTQESADPIEAPRATKKKGGGFRKWRARFIVLVLLAAAVLLFWRISRDRAGDAARIDLGTVTLTAQPIPVEVAQTGQVAAVVVTAQQRVAAGQRLGTIDVATTDADGDPKITKVNITAPRPGIIVDLPVTVGSSLAPGQPFVELYDPAQLRFETQVLLEDLPEIAPSMTARLETEGITRTVRAQVQRVIPRVGDPTDPNVRAPNRMTVVLVPTGPDQVQGLVPGMRFTGYVDTDTGRPGSPRLVSLGSLSAGRS
jgi:multidrug resistance efflux pump